MVECVPDAEKVRHCLELGSAKVIHEPEAVRVPS